MDGLGWPRASLCINTGYPRDEAPVGRAGWPAGPDIPPGERRWDSEAHGRARADGINVWALNRRTKQLACMQRDLAAHTTALGTADAPNLGLKWVNRQCAQQELLDAAARNEQHE